MALYLLSKASLGQRCPRQGHEQHLLLLSGGRNELGMDVKPLRFIGEPVEVQFDQPSALEKKPDCPSRFVWRGKTYPVVEKLSEWHDYSRRGRMARNMRSTHLTAASRRGSWGVGRDYYRVRTASGQVFDLYYDRRPKGVDDRKGAWFLYREMCTPQN